MFNVGDQARERARFGASGAVFVDQGDELRIAVESCAGDAGGDSNGGECDPAASRGELGQRTFHDGNAGLIHAVFAPVIRMSRRSMSVRWRSASLAQPRACASRTSMWASARWAVSTATWVLSVR